jgi:hypothetical protein
MSAFLAALTSEKCTPSPEVHSIASAAERTNYAWLLERVQSIMGLQRRGRPGLDALFENEVGQL